MKIFKNSTKTLVFLSFFSILSAFLYTPEQELSMDKDVIFINEIENIGKQNYLPTVYVIAERLPPKS